MNNEKFDLENQIAFTTRQFEHFKLRAIQSQISAQLAIANKDYAKAKQELKTAQRHLDFINSCHELIGSMHNRLIEMF